MSATIVGTYPDIGGVKRALKGLILGAAYVAILNTLMDEYADGVPLEPPAQDAVFTSEKATLPSFPAFEIVGDANIRINADSHLQDYQHRIVLFVTALADDEEVVTAKCERYVLALRRLLWDRDLTLVQGCAPITLGNEEFSPVGRHEHGALVKTAALDLTVPTYV